MEYSDPRDFGFRPETVMTALMPYEQYSSKTRRLILGIDMGIASVGVCLIDIRNHEIILMASHIFKAPVEGKQKDISAACRDGIKSAGFHWKYVSEYDN